MSQIIPLYIPTYISDATYAPSRVLPRLFFYNGMIECEEWWFENGSLTTAGVGYAQTAFPYFDNYNVVTGSFPTTDSLSLLFNNENASYGEVPTGSLYTTYWENYVSLLYNPKTRLVNCSAIIPLKDYFTMELNDIVNFRGNYYHLRAINDYSLKDGSCTLQLLGPIIADTFSAEYIEPTPIPTASGDFATASINLNELNSGSIFIDGNIIVSGSPYYFSGNFTQYVTGGVVADVTMEGKYAASTVWGGYTTASATLTILDNGTLITSSTQYIYSGSSDTIITVPTTFTTGHIITISGSTAVVGNPTPPPPGTATLAWSFSELAGARGQMDLYVNGSIIVSRLFTSSGTYTVNVGDTINVELTCDDCGGDYANVECSGIIYDIDCAPPPTGIANLFSATYTVVSGDVGTTLTLDNQAVCTGGGCL